MPSNTSATCLLPLFKVAGTTWQTVSFNKLETTATVRDIYRSGNGRISGTTMVKATPDYSVSRRVRLIREVDGLMIRETWSDPKTGAYSFDYIDSTYKYTVITYDYTASFRAAIADNLTPDLIQ